MRSSCRKNFTASLKTIWGSGFLSAVSLAVRGRSGLPVTAFFGRSGFGCDAAAAVCCPGALCFFAAAALHSLAGRSCFPVGGSACLRGISGMEFVIFNPFCYLCPNK